MGLAVFTKDDNCSCGKKTMKKGCCKNQNIHVTLNGEQKAASAITTKIDFTENFSYHLIVDDTFTMVAGNFISVKNYHAPPPKLNNSLLIWNSILQV